MKFKRFFAALPGRISLIIAIAVILIFFSNDFGLVDIPKTAIILALGLDKEEETLKLTAQIAVPKGSDRTTGGTSSVEIDGEGQTVPDCLSQIYTKTGWVPKLIFCNLILLGESVVKEDVFDCLDFFLRNENIPNSCQLAACVGSAGDMLSSQSAIEDTTGIAFTKLFSDAAKKSGYVMTTTLRAFSIGYYGASGSGYMPYIRSQAQEGSQSVASSGGANGAQGEEKEQKVFLAEETAIFSKGKLAAILPREQTFVFSLLEGNVYAGTFGEDGVTYVVLEDDGSVDVQTNGEVKATLSLDLRVRLHAMRKISSPDEIAKGELTKEQQEHAKEMIERCLSGLWQICVETDCDVLDLKTKLYRSSPTDYEQFKDDFFSVCSPEIRANVKSVS